MDNRRLQPLRSHDFGTNRSMKNFRPLLIVGLCLAVLLVAWPETAVACPTCKDGLAENDPAGRAIAAGYFWSILFMMSMPFLIIGSFASYAYYIVQRADRQGGQRSSSPS